MKFAIIAAGEGSRLAQEGICVPKPLVRIGGEPLVDRLVRVFTACNASEIVVICRPDGTGNTSPSSVAKHLQQLQARCDIPLRVLTKATPSSMHSLFELSPYLDDEPFVLTTVDTIFREAEFQKFVTEFKRIIAAVEADGLMGVTTYIDDEKPLYVRTVQSSQGRDDEGDLDVTAFLDSDEAPLYISGGIYGLTPRSLLSLRACIERGESRMRNFQRALLADGLHLRAYPFTKVLDIDHAADIAKAEQFITDYHVSKSPPRPFRREGERNSASVGAGPVPARVPMKILVLARAPQFSPNSVENDRAILMAVTDRLRAQGHSVEIASEQSINSSLSKQCDIDLCLSMGRLPSTLTWLKTLQMKGVRVINRPEAVELCNNRSALTRLMQQNYIPMPPSCLSHLRAGTGSDSTSLSSLPQGGAGGGFSPLSSQFSQFSPLPFWLKRGDACAQSAGDVVFCQDETELESQIQIFQQRGITNYVVSQHIEGDLLKFYGVLSPSSGWHRARPYTSHLSPLRSHLSVLISPFFRCFCPTDDGQTKFGDEKHNGPAHHYIYNKVEFQRQAERLATLAGLHIFGGDAIIQSDGSFYFIDLNDWPSFSRCREEAAEAIANVGAGPVPARK